MASGQRRLTNSVEASGSGHLLRPVPRGPVAVPPGAAREHSGPARLESWKSVAVYLKRDISTVQRWEKREAMPVHRHLHDKIGSVYAYPSELDCWWQGRTRRTEPEQPRPALSPGTAASWKRAAKAAIAALALTAAATAGFWLGTRGLPIVGRAAPASTGSLARTAR